MPDVGPQIRPFRIEVAQAELDDLSERLARARWTDELPGAGLDYGVPVTDVRRLAEYWRTGYDWRAWEARLNEYDQFTTDIDGQNIHFLHVRSQRPDAYPLVRPTAGPLLIIETERDRSAGPGKVRRRPSPRVPPGDSAARLRLLRAGNRSWLGTVRTAKAWAEVMRRLEYDH
jgi:hypothetical protein